VSGVTSQEISQADAAREYGVDVSVIIRLRALAKDAALAALALVKPGRPAPAEPVELELLRSQNDRLSEALKAVARQMRNGEGRPLKFVELLDRARKVELGDLFALRTGGFGLEMLDRQHADDRHRDHARRESTGAERGRGL
jgi:transposase-like protein